MHEGGRRNPRVVAPWVRDAAFDIREEFASRAVRTARAGDQTSEEPVESADIEDPKEDGEPVVPSKDADR